VGGGLERWVGGVKNGERGVKTTFIAKREKKKGAFLKEEGGPVNLTSRKKRRGAEKGPNGGECFPQGEKTQKRRIGTNQGKKRFRARGCTKTGSDRYDWNPELEASKPLQSRGIGRKGIVQRATEKLTGGRSNPRKS